VFVPAWYNPHPRIRVAPFTVHMSRVRLRNVSLWLTAVYHCGAAPYILRWLRRRDVSLQMAGSSVFQTLHINIRYRFEDIRPVIGVFGGATYLPRSPRSRGRLVAVVLDETAAGGLVVSLSDNCRLLFRAKCRSSMRRLVTSDKDVPRWNDIQSWLWEST